MLVVQHEVLSAFSLRTSLGFLLKAKRFLVAVSVRNFEAVLRIFWELGPRNRAPNLFSLGCLPLSCSACVPYVEWFWVGSYISLFLFLCLLMVETKGGRYISVTGGCSCQDYSLTCCVCGFFFLLFFFLKLEIILWMQGSTGISPEKQLQIWLRTELLQSAGGGFLCVTLNYHFFPIS